VKTQQCPFMNQFIICKFIFTHIAVIRCFLNYYIVQQKENNPNLRIGSSRGPVVPQSRICSTLFNYKSLSCSCRKNWSERSNCTALGHCRKNIGARINGIIVPSLSLSLSLSLYRVHRALLSFW
jgi:hypothetical protein